MTIAGKVKRTPTKAYTVEDWDEKIFLRKFSARNARRMTRDIDEDDGIKRIAASVAAGTCNAEGEYLYDWNDIDELMERDLDTLTAIAHAVCDFNGLSMDVKEHDGAVAKKK